MYNVNKFLFMLNGIAFVIWGLRYIFYFVIGEIQGRKSHIIHKLSLSLEEVLLGTIFLFLFLFYKNIFSIQNIFLQPYVFIINLLFLIISIIRVVRYFIDDDPINDSTSRIIFVKEKH